MQRKKKKTQKHPSYISQRMCPKRVYPGAINKAIHLLAHSITHSLMPLSAAEYRERRQKMEADESLLAVAETRDTRVFAHFRENVYSGMRMFIKIFSSAKKIAIAYARARGSHENADISKPDDYAACGACARARAVKSGFSDARVIITNLHKSRAILVGDHA